MRSRGSCTGDVPAAAAAADATTVEHVGVPALGLCNKCIHTFATNGD